MNGNILCAGYGRRSITPLFSVPLSGFGMTHKRMSDNVLSELYASCIAFSYGDEKLLLYTQDMVHTNAQWTAEVRSRIRESMGVPEDRVLICATHTHSGPDMESPLPCIAQYKELYLDAMVETAREALEDLAPARILGTSTVTEGMAYVRHYTAADGSIQGIGKPNTAPIVGHVCDSDQQLRVIKLERQEKPSILMVNFQVHPTAHGGSTRKDISSDFIGTLRDYMEASTQMHFAYFTGAAGNQTIGSKLLKENENMDANLRKKIGLYNPLIYGWYLGQYITKALARLEELPCDGIYAQRVYFEQPVNHDDEHLYDVACKVRQIFAGDDPDARAKATAYGKEHGISTVFHAGAIRARKNRPQTQKLELNAVRIGQLAFVTFPYETFGATGVYVKSNSPLPMTLVFSVANEHWSYTPTREAYEFGCYESSISYFAKGTAEACAEKLVDMLRSLQ